MQDEEGEEKYFLKAKKNCLEGTLSKQENSSIKANLKMYCEDNLL